MTDISRRQFAAAATAAALTGFQAAAKPPDSRFIKGICRGVFPKGMPLLECYRQAKNAGFDAIECPMLNELAPTVAPDEVKRLRDEAKKAGVGIAALWVSELGNNPLNSPDAEVRARGIEAIRKAVEFAGYLDCGFLLMVPGAVGYGTKFICPYETTWQRFTVELKKAIPFAEQAKVVLTVENVGNRFLVSPLEMRSFVDQFQSPWLQSFFDIGNVMQFGYPQDWILTLGPRIKRVHAKDPKVTPNPGGGRPGLLEGDVDWKAVMAALTQVGYKGSISPEIGYNPDDPDQLKKISTAMDKILAMA
jgi:L-ribulose-5-phosphate 3-epimerase